MICQVCSVCSVEDLIENMILVNVERSLDRLRRICDILYYLQGTYEGKRANILVIFKDGSHQILPRTDIAYKGVKQCRLSLGNCSD